MHRADRFFLQVKQAAKMLQGTTFAFSGDTARCLWMLAGIPGGSYDLWKRICHPGQAKSTSLLGIR